MEFGKVFRFFGNKVTEGLPKFHCACSDEHFGEKFFFGKRIGFASFPEFEQNIFKVLTTNFSRGGHKCILHVQKHNLRKNNLPSKNFIIFLFFWNLSDKSVVFWKKFFGRVVKNAFSVARESLLMKTNSVKKIITPPYLDCGKVFRFFGNKVTESLPKFHCACSDEHFGEKIFCLESA